MKTRKLFLCNGTGNGKSTLLERIQRLPYNDVVLHHNVSKTALGNNSKTADFNLRQTRLINHIWTSQIASRVNDPTLHVYDRSILDYMDASLRSNDARAYSAGLTRWSANVLKPTPEFWDGCIFVVAPTPTLEIMRENFEQYTEGKRGEYWSEALGIEFLKNVAPSQKEEYTMKLLHRIHEQMVRSEAWITSQLKYLDHVCRQSGSNLTVINFNETSNCVYDKYDNFFKWQDLALATLDSYLRSLAGHCTYKV